LKRAASEAVIIAESKAIRDTLKLTDWNRKKAAAMLNISYNALFYKMKRSIDQEELNT
jgi:DNA-binding NtrC family response regulator